MTKLSAIRRQSWINLYHLPCFPGDADELLCYQGKNFSFAAAILAISPTLQFRLITYLECGID